MIFKRNVRGLLERETLAPPGATPPGSSPSSALGASNESGGIQPPLYTSHQGSPAVSFGDRSSKDVVRSTSPYGHPGHDAGHHRANYPQEDFPHYGHQDQDPTLLTPNVNQLTSAIMEKSSEETPETTLGEGVCFKGELIFKRYLSIHGEFEGRLVSNGRLHVGKKGIVRSNLQLQSAIIEGLVVGDINVDGLLELRACARVFGNIRARYLRVDDGVTLMGHVRIDPKGEFAESEGFGSSCQATGLQVGESPTTLSLENELTD